MIFFIDSEPEMQFRSQRFWTVLCLPMLHYLIGFYMGNAIAPIKKGKLLTLRIKKVWLEEIISGKKKIEYRDNTTFYWQRIGKYLDLETDAPCRYYDAVYFYCPIGTTGKILRATFECKKIAANVKDNCYEIHLGKQIKDKKKS